MRMIHQVGDILPREFYSRDPSVVAKDLLGKMLVRVFHGELLAGIIVETEAYYGRGDPASRAFRSKGDLTKTLFGEAGMALVYGVHGRWLFNIVAHPPQDGGGVLIRALEPRIGLETMKKLRKVKNIKELTNGPGKLSQAMAIDKSFHRCPVYLETSPINVRFGIEVGEFCTSHRVGVTKDLPAPLRFFIRGSEFVSKPRL